MAKLTPKNARAILFSALGTREPRDFHALPSDAVESLLLAADAEKYRTPKNAPGSRARMFYQHVVRVAAREG